MRRWLPADRAPFAALNADPRVMEHFPALLSREESDAMASRIEAGFGERGFGKLAEVVSFTTPDNLRSRRVMEKIGMTPTTSIIRRIRTGTDFDATSCTG